MYYNNLNRQQEDDDLKFMPLNIREPFLDKDSSWFPIIDMALPDFSELPNNFLLGFATPVDNSNLEGNSLKTLDFIQNNNVNLQNPANNQSAEEFSKNFDLEYPSETLSEELHSYNKDIKCKSLNGSTNNMPMKNNSSNNGNMSGMKNSNMNIGNENIQGINNGNMQGYNANYGNTQGTNTNEVNNTNMKGLNGYNYNNNQGVEGREINNISTSSKNSKGDNQDEPIHMRLLRNFNFEGFLDSDYRGESGSQIEEIDRIFNIVKSDNSIIQTLKAYNVPKPISDLIIKKIIKITLENSKYKWGE